MVGLIASFIVGSLAMVGGVLIVRHRVHLYEGTRRRQRRLVGRNAAGAFERLQRPFWVGFVGVWFVAIGIAVIVSGVIRIASAS
ncbi:hypothetical protein [Microbacterium luteum]|uniref:hypothetical protein n=1 Tax=Microbacterium luteum TaxID=2782167 RepID=UPI001887AB5E|nr:hypothetical protein [Microbacterium luteum]